jgi:hypothetical protein
VGAACSFDGDSRFGMFVLGGDWLYGIDGSANVTGLFDFGLHWSFEPAISGTQAIESRGGYVGAAIAVTPKGDPNPKQAGVQLLLAEASGKVLFHSMRVFPYQNFIDVTVHGNELGVFAFSIQTPDGHRLELVGPHGEHFGPVAGVRPITDPDPSGRIAILQGSDHYWLDPCAGTRTRIAAEQLGEYTTVRPIGPALAWVDPSRATAALETADQVAELGLPLDPSASLFRAHPAGWILAGTSVSPWTFASANVASTETRPFGIELVPGTFRFGSFGSAFTGFDSNSDELGLASDGSIFLGMRDASVGRLYRSFDGASWSQVGLSVGKVYTLVALERSGSFLIAGTPMGRLPDDWAPAPPGVQRFDYQQTQLVRPSAGIATVLAQATLGTGFTRSYSLAADGGCAGTLLDDKLEITNALTAQKTVITLPTFTPVYGVWSFVPGPMAARSMN